MRKLRYAPRSVSAARRVQLAQARDKKRSTGTTSVTRDTLPVGWQSPLLRSGCDVTLFLSIPPVRNRDYYLEDIDYYSGLDSFPTDLYPRDKALSKGPSRYELAPSEIHKVARVNKEPGALLENLHYAAQELVTLYQTTLDEKVKVIALKHFMDCQMEQIRAARDMQLIVQGISEERWTKIKARLTELVEEHPELEKDIRKALEG